MTLNLNHVGHSEFSTDGIRTKHGETFKIHSRTFKDIQETLENSNSKMFKIIKGYLIAQSYG